MLPQELQGMQRDTATCEDSLSASYKAKYSLTIWSNNHTPQYLPKGAESLGPHENLHRHVHGSLFTDKTHKQPRYPSTGDG